MKSLTTMVHFIYKHCCFSELCLYKPFGITIGPSYKTVDAASKEDCTSIGREQFPDSTGMNWSEQLHDCYADYSNHVITVGPTMMHYNWWACIYAGIASSFFIKFKGGFETRNRY